MDREKMQRIGFRPVNIDSDVQRLYTWLGDPEVRRWYDEGEHSLENYRQQFAPEPTTHKFIILGYNEPIGFLQAYRLSDEPDYAAQLDLSHDAVGLDLFIGEPGYRGGWGSLVLRAALDLIVFGSLDAEFACCNPDPENSRAVCAYEKAGFRGERVVWIEDDAPGNTGYERIMFVSREEFYSFTSW